MQVPGAKACRLAGQGQQHLSRVDRALSKQMPVDVCEYSLQKYNMQ